MIYKPLVSVIIPTFERSPNLIDRSIKSALNQTYSNLEIIVIDDSTNTYKKRNEVEKYLNSLKDDRLIYIKHNENMGANVARNNGIRHSKGEFCAFLDDDDEWELNKIELQLNKIIESNSGLVYCKGKVIDDKTGEVKPLNNKLKRGFIFEDLIYNNFIGGNSFVLIRKNVINEVGHFNESMLSNQDWELFLRVSQNYKIEYVEEYLVNYYNHSDHRISTNPSKKLQGWECLFDLYSSYLEGNPKVQNYWELNMISIYFKNKKYFRCIYMIFKTAIYSPQVFYSYFKKIYKIKTT